MLKDACSAKRHDLRVREDNPAENVASPDKGVRKAKPTKTNTARHVPIEPGLLPLLVVMKEEAKGTGPVLATKATDRKFSRQLRRCLKLAGVTRAELFPDEARRTRGRR